MKRCPKCNTQNNDADQFCYVCGNQLESDPGNPHCGKCGAELKPGAHFCGVCGTKTAVSRIDLKKLGNASGSSPEASASPGKSVKRPAPEASASPGKSVKGKGPGRSVDALLKAAQTDYRAGRYSDCIR